MTKKQKSRRKRSAADFDEREDDFILADLDSTLDDVEPVPVPLNHLLDDEEVIERLLVSVNPNDDELAIEADEPLTAALDDMALTGQIEDFEEFIPEPLNWQKQKKTKVKAIRPEKHHLKEASIDEIPPVKDAIDRLLDNTGFDETSKTDITSQPFIVNDISLTDDSIDETDYVIDLENLNEPDQEVEIDIVPGFDLEPDINSEELIDENKINPGSPDNNGNKANAGKKGDDRDLAMLAIDEIDSKNECWDGDQDVNQPDNITMLNLEAKNEKIFTEDIHLSSGSDSQIAVLETHAGLDNLISGEHAAAGLFLATESISGPAKQHQPISEANNPGADLKSTIDEASMIKNKTIESDQDSINQQAQGTENHSKKIPIITYLSLAFAVAAFLSSIIMGVLLFKMQNKVSKLNDLVAILEEDMSGMAEKESDLEVNNDDSENGKLATKTSRSDEKTEKTTASTSVVSEHKLTTINHRTSEDTKAVENPAAKSPVPGKKELSATDKTEPVRNKVTKIANAGGWSVNLMAYEDLDYAKSRAAKYLQKKVPVKVVTVDMNNSTWYRLKVDGFKNKEEADAYAAKIKKSLNLSTVTVVNK